MNAIILFALLLGSFCSQYPVFAAHTVTVELGQDPPSWVSTTQEDLPSTAIALPSSSGVALPLASDWLYDYETDMKSDEETLVTNVSSSISEKYACLKSLWIGSLDQEGCDSYVVWNWMMANLCLLAGIIFQILTDWTYYLTNLAIMGLSMVLGTLVLSLAIALEWMVSFLENAIYAYLLSMLLLIWHMAITKPKLIGSVLVLLKLYSLTVSLNFYVTLAKILMTPIVMMTSLMLWITLLPLRLLTTIIPKRIYNFLFPTKTSCHGEHCTCKGWGVKEAIISGLHTLTLAADPPKGNIVTFREENGNHIGYGSVCKLEGGSVGIAVPLHVLQARPGEPIWIHGPKGSLTVDKFYVDFCYYDGDLIILGCLNEKLPWAALLGVKARKFKPITQTYMGGHKIYHQNTEGKWFCQTAMIKGLSDANTFLRTVYNSEPGFSGLPIYNEKSEIVGVHSGRSSEYMENEAAYLLDIPGYSSPPMFEGFRESMYQDTAVLKGVYNIDEDAIEIHASLKGKKHTVKITPLAQLKNPWDEDENDLDDFYAKNDVASLRKMWGVEKENPKKGDKRCFNSPATPENDFETQAAVIGRLQYKIDKLERVVAKMMDDMTALKFSFKRPNPEPDWETNRKETGENPRECRGGACGGNPCFRDGNEENEETTNRPYSRAKDSKKPKEARTAQGEESCSEGRSSKSEGGGKQEGESCSYSGSQKESLKGNSSGQYGLQRTFSEDRSEGHRKGCDPRPEGSSFEKTAIEAQVSSFFNFQTENRHESSPAPEGFRWAGRCRAFYHTPPFGFFSNWGRKALESSTWLYERVKGFGPPLKGPEAELQSLRLQASRRAAQQAAMICPSKSKREEVIREVTKRYEHVSLTAPDWIRNGFNVELARRYFLECVSALQMDAGSGVPYAQIENRRFNGDWFTSAEVMGDLWRLVLARLQRMLDYTWISPEQAVFDGVTDPVRLFIKGEPHKISKIQEGRFRIIASVSLVDQLVARMLFQDQNKIELARYRDLPSQPGMGLSQDWQVKEFTGRLAQLAGAPSAKDLVRNWGKYLVPTDCSGFDWSVPMWLLEDDLEIRNRLTLQLSPELKQLRHMWLTTLGNSLFCLSDGALLAQTTPGIQKSGSYNTSSSNSRIRVLMSVHAGAEWCVAMGDDAIESPTTNLSVYQDLGFKCERAESFDFCSHIFHSEDVAVPCNVGKMLLGLLCGVSPESESDDDKVRWMISATSVLQELRHLPSQELTEIFSALQLK
uniref:P1-P2 fusion protein n=1 Tax=Celmisia lyallii enamovirus TaxID=2885090 RepID=A0AAD2KQ83_9VIRU